MNLKKIIAFYFFVSIAMPVFAQTEFKLRKAVSDYLGQSNSGFYFSMIAEVHDSTSAIAIFWPCILDNAIVDDKLIAVEFEKEKENWVAVELLQGEKLKTLIEKIDNDTTIRMSSSCEKDSMGTFIFNKVNHIHQLLNYSNSHRAAQEIEKLSAIMGLDVIVNGKLLSELILQGVKSADIYEFTKTDKSTVFSAKLEIYFQTEAKIFSIKLIKGSFGWQISSIK